MSAAEAEFYSSEVALPYQFVVMIAGGMMEEVVFTLSACYFLIVEDRL